MNKMNNAFDVLNTSKNIVVLTGAGISTESGIRDFRSRTGLYKMAPEYILSLNYFQREPKEFYEFAIENLYHPEALPNDGHDMIAKWEREGRVSVVITQNIDGLHQKAGSRNVIEFHGTMKTASCQNCGEKYTTEEMVKRMSELDDFYVCSSCHTKKPANRYIKPDVVLFGDSGEWFTKEGFETILKKIRESDCLLVLGSSLQVTPFSMFPQYRSSGVPMVIINRGNTPYDFAEDVVVVNDSIGKVLLVFDQKISP